MASEKQIFIPNQTARQKLAERLNLEFSEFMQDWEYEISDKNRISEFLDEYDNEYCSADEKASLMEIILDSLDELKINNSDSNFSALFKRTMERLKLNAEIHQGTLQYWRNNGFNISDDLKNN